MSGIIISRLFPINSLYSNPKIEQILKLKLIIKPKLSLFAEQIIY